MTFFREALLDIILESECLFVDGTFKLSPPKFSQVVVIIGKKRELAVPVLYCLLQVRLLSVIIFVTNKQKVFISETLVK